MKDQFIYLFFVRTNFSDVKIDRDYIESSLEKSNFQIQNTYSEFSFINREDN